MRFLADAGISPRTVEFLAGLGHEAVHVRTLGLQRSPDLELVERARGDGSVVLTFDLDFGDILALGVLDKPSVVLFRLTDERAESVNRRLSTVLDERRGELEATVADREARLPSVAKFFLTDARSNFRFRVVRSVRLQPDFLRSA